MRPTITWIPAFLLASGLAGQTPGADLLADIETAPAGTLRSSSNPADFLTVGSRVFFAAASPITGHELYVTDGSAAGTRLVADLSPGSIGSTPQGLTEFGGQCFFSAETPGRGRELYRTDGTTGGTQLIADLTPGPGSSHPGGFTVFANALYFTLGDGSYDLWKTDGTTAGTVRVQSMGTALGTQNATAMVAAGNHIYFGAPELWISDGTAAGTKLLDANFKPTAFTALGTDAYAVAPTLFRCTPTGTTRLAIPDRDARGLVTLGSSVYVNLGLITYQRGYPENYYQWVRADAQGYMPLSAIPSNSRLIGAVGSTPYFEATGSQAGIYTIPRGRITTLPGTALWTFGNSIYYSDSTGLGRYDLVSGTTTTLSSSFSVVATGAPRPYGTLSSGRIVFPGTDPKRGVELFETNGTPPGTGLVAEIYPTPATGENEGSRPSFLFEAAGRVFFRATTQALGAELYVSDGTTAGTRLVADLLPGPGSSNPVRFALLGDSVVFTADTASGPAIWISDGTASGTRMVRQFASTSGFGTFYELHSVGGYVYFKATSSQKYDLWRTDGTTAGTTKIRLDVDLSFPTEMISVGNELYSHVAGHGIWKIRNGTAQPIGSPTVAYPAGTAGDWFFFHTYNPHKTWAVPLQGGTPAVIADVTAEFPQLVAGEIYFWAIYGLERRIFRTDGTAAGTYPLPVPLSVGSLGAEFAEVGGQALLRNSLDVFLSDGTLANTTRLKRTHTNASSTTPSNYARSTKDIGGRKAYFGADDGWTGLELHVTDGTAAGTRRLTEIFPGIRSSMRRRAAIVECGDKIIFDADGVNVGSELWSVDVGANAQPIGSGCSDRARVPNLRTNSPVLGASIGMQLDHGTPSQAGLALLGAPSTGMRHTYLGSGCTIYLDTSAPNIAIPFRTDSAGSWRQSGYAVPNLPALKGARLVLQAGVGPTSKAPLGMDLSNGVLLVLGDR